MGFFDQFSDSSDAYNDHPEPHQASLSHELLGGAAAFEAAKAYEDHCKKNGKPANHAVAKELLDQGCMYSVYGIGGSDGTREQADKWDQVKANRARKHAQQQVEENFTENVYVENY